MAAIIKKYQSTEVERAVTPVGVRAGQTSLGELGGAIGQVGETLNLWQDEVDTADAKAADAAYSDLIRQELYADQTGFMYSQGSESIGRRGTVAERIEAEQKRLLSGLNPAARSKAEVAMVARYQRALQTVDTHTASQRQVYLDSAAQARVTSSIQDAIFNPDQTAQSIALADQEIRDMAARNGWAPEVTALKLKEARTEVHAGVIKRLETVSPVQALEYLQKHKGDMTGDVVATYEAALAPKVKEYRGRDIARRLLGGGNVSMDTRAVNKPSASSINISMDFNASAGGGARGTEVIIPDNASPELRAAAEDFNKRVVAFAAKHGIAHPNRGVRTRSENGRGVANTVHAEPFFNDNIELQKVIAANLDEFSAIYVEAFGHVPGTKIIPPHGVGSDRGAASDVFGSETAFGKRMAQSIIEGRSTVANDISAMQEIIAISDPDERAAAVREFKLLTGVRDMSTDAARMEAANQAFAHVVGGGSVDEFSTEMQVTIGLQGMASLRAYQENLAAGGKVETDPETFVQLEDLAARDPEAFATLDPLKWLNRLDEGDYQYFVKKRADIIAGTRTKASAAPDVSAIRTAAKGALDAAGITSKDDPKVVSGFESQMLRWADSFTRDNGRQPSPLELNERINQMLIPVVLDPPGLRNKQATYAGLVDYDGDPLNPDDDLTPEMVRDGGLKINGTAVENEVIETFAISFEKRFGRAPTVQEMIDGLVESGYYE